MQHEVDAAHQRRDQGGHALSGSLGVGDLRGTEVAARPERDAETTGQRRHRVEHQRRLGCAEGRGTGLHRHGRGERAEDHGGAGPDQLDERHPGQCLGEGLGGDAGDRDGCHGTGEDERADHRRLHVARIDLGGSEHRGVPGHGRRGVDQARHHRVLFDEVVAEGDPGQVDRVLGPLGSGDGPHERLVAVAEVGVHHVEVSLVDRDVDRLAHRAPRHVHVWTLVRQLHEVPEVVDRAVAAALVDVVDEGRAVGGHEHGGVATDLHAVFRIASVVCVDGGSVGCDDLPAHAPGEPHPLAVHLGTRRPQEFEGARVVPEVDAEFLEDRVGVLLDQGQAVLGHDLERRHGPDQVRVDARRSGLRPGSLARCPTSGSATGCIAHWPASSRVGRRRRRPESSALLLVAEGRSGSVRAVESPG